MDGRLRKALTDSIRDIETGKLDVRGCLEQHPDLATELRPHLELWATLEARPKTQPGHAGRQRGQERLLNTLAETESEEGRRRIPFLTPALAKAAMAMAGVALFAAGAAGASAALGGPDIAGEALSTFGITNAPEAAQTGIEHANPNAFEGSDNAGQGIENASDTGKEHANPNAFEGSDNAGQGIENASDTGREHANPNEVTPGPSSLPDKASVPDSAPRGPKP